jgi:hypothetical protein
MVAEELTQLTSRAIAFPKPDVSESCDRPSSSIDLLITVIAVFKQGTTAEEIVDRYPSRSIG